MLHRIYFLIPFFMLHACLEGMKTQYHHPFIPNTSEFKKLKNEFGEYPVQCILSAYQNNQYAEQPTFKAWSYVADTVIGTQYVEEQRRYFLVNAMLHTQMHNEGLQILYDCFNNHLASRYVQHSYQSKKSVNTPQGSICTQMESDQYDAATKVSNDLRAKIFVNGISPLVLVKKTDNEMFPAAKWSLFKVGAVMTHLISLCLEKEDKDKKKKENTSVRNFLVLSDAMQKAEEDIRKSLEKNYPILKTHEVKSLVDDKKWWISDSKNWIMCGSAACMAILLLCLLRDKIPNMPFQHVYSLIIVT